MLIFQLLHPKSVNCAQSSCAENESRVFARPATPAAVVKVGGAVPTVQALRLRQQMQLNSAKRPPSTAIALHTSSPSYGPVTA